MKVLLLKDIKGLGKVNEIVNVSEGYARNMLIPSKSALIATDTVIKQVKEKEASMKAKDAKNREEAKALAEIISKEKILIPSKCGQNTKLFGSITSHEIAEVINSKYNLKIDKKNVHIKEPIKSLGNYTIEVKLYTGVIAEVSIEVVEDNNDK